MKLNEFINELINPVFPFLNDKELMGKEPINELIFKEFHSGLLNKKPWINEYQWCNGGYRNYKGYIVITDDNKCIVLDSSYDYSDGSGNHNNYEALNIGNQLKQLNVRVDLIVCIEFNDNDANDNGIIEKIVTIYKCNKETINKYYLKQLEMNYNKLIDELKY